MTRQLLPTVNGDVNARLADHYRRVRTTSDTLA